MYTRPLIKCVLREEQRRKTNKTNRANDKMTVRSPFELSLENILWNLLLFQVTLFAVSISLKEQFDATFCFFKAPFLLFSEIPVFEQICLFVSQQT